MFKSKLSIAVSQALVFGSISLFSQSTHAATEAETEQPEKILITGSRIKHTSAQMTAPTTIIDAEAIAQSGAKNIADLMNRLPALVNGVGGNAINNNNGGNINNAGLELANLRGLGTNRTLVLVDGRRHVAGSAGTSAVDMSMIPTAMVERVEVITGGASAIYGADAVTGVVNFIMRKDFTGFEVDASIGQTSYSDGKSNDLSLTFGQNYLSDKGNFTFHASYSDEEEISIAARDYANKNHTFSSNPANGSNDDGIPDLIFYEDQRFQALSAEGLFYVPNQNYLFGGLPITQVSTIIGPPIFADDPFGFGYDTFTIDREDGHFRPFQAGTNCMVVPCEGGDGFRTEETGTLNVPSERLLMNLRTHYDISQSHRIYAEAKYAKTQSAASNQASVFHDDNFGPLVVITDENPFRPTELVDLMAQRNLQSVGLAVIGMNARSETTRETTQFMFGGEGVVGAYDYSFYAQYGQVSSEIINDDVLNENYYRALDAVSDADGNAVCRSAATNPDCVAYNPIFFQASDAAKAYAGVKLRTEDEIEQTVMAFTLGGELFETSAGIVDFVVGAEYRKESSESNPDELTQAIDADGIGSGLVGSMTGPSREQNIYLKPTQGSYDVSEIFGELLIPLVDGVPFVDTLDLELAGRYADHSVTGGDFTYKTALNWSIVSDLRARYTLSHAVRAPNIQELFAPEQATGASMVDPCSASNIGSGPLDSNREQNCYVLGIQPGFVSSADFGTRTELQGGNTQLNPEKADTYTVGLVYTPSNNFSLALDYWDVEIKDAITTYNPTFILNSCVDGQSINPLFCDLINRNEQGQILNVRTQSINVAAFVASGVDMDVNYSIDLAEYGDLNFNLNATYLDERKFFNNLADPTDKQSLAGQVGSPHLRALLNTVYRIHDLTANWSLNYIGESTFNKEASDETYEDWFDNSVGSYSYHNLNLNYALNDQFSLYAGIDNVTDKRPPALPNLNAGSLLYDGVGRKYYLGLRYKL